MFTPTEALKNYLAKDIKDLKSIRRELRVYINTDMYFVSDDFDQAVSYVLSSGITEEELYTEFNSELNLEEDTSKWDRIYYSYQIAFLKDDFSKKRIAHVKKVGKYLRPADFGKNNEAPKETSAKKVTARTSQISQSRAEQETSKETLKMAIMAGAAVLIVLIILIYVIIKLQE